MTFCSTLLKKRIDDDRFIGLIEGMLKAGYMEDWVFGRTYSGTPQGGVVSPLLANIYLHELDQLMQRMKAGFDKGRDRRRVSAATRRCKGASFVSAGRLSGSAPMVRSRPRSMPQWQRSKPSTRRDGKYLPSIPWTPTSKGSATVDTPTTS